MSDQTDRAIRAVLAQMRGHLGMSVGDWWPAHVLPPVQIDSARRLVPRIEDLLDAKDSGAIAAGEREAAQIRGALAEAPPVRHAVIVTTPEGDRVLVEAWQIVPQVSVRRDDRWPLVEHVDGWTVEVVAP